MKPLCNILCILKQQVDNLFLMKERPGIATIFLEYIRRIYSKDNH